MGMLMYGRQGKLDPVKSESESVLNYSFYQKREKTKEREEKQRFGVCLSGIEVCLSEFRNMGHLSKIYTYQYW